MTPMHPVCSNRRGRGFTLTEMMLAMLLASLLIAGALRLYSTARISYASTENIATLEERAAFVLALLKADIQLAGFWGRHSDATLLRAGPGITTVCGGQDVSTWALRLQHSVSAVDNGHDLPCMPASAQVAGSDTLTLRHASPQTSVPQSGRIQIHTNETTGELFNDGSPPALPEAHTYDLQVNSWFLDRNSSEPGQSALHRYQLVSNGLLQKQEIMPGVEQFQVSLGIDQDGDQRIDSFVDADAADPAQIMAVRIWLLLRSARPEPGHRDAGTWRSIDQDDPQLNIASDGYRRLSTERTIWLRNQGNG